MDSLKSWGSQKAKNFDSENEYGSLVKKIINVGDPKSLADRDTLKSTLL